MSAWLLPILAVGVYALGKSALNKLPPVSSVMPPTNPQGQPVTQVIPAQSASQASIPTRKQTISHLLAHDAVQEALDLEWQDAGLQLPRHNSGDFANPSWIAGMESDVLKMWPNGITADQMAGYKTGLPPSNPASVSTGSKDLHMVSTVGGLALATAGVVTSSLGGAAAVSAAGGVGASLAGGGGALAGATAAIPFIGVAIAGIVGIFSVIQAHHAAAVKLEQQIFYSLGPAAFNYLQIIRQSVLKGQASPQEAIHALDSLQADYFKAATPAVKHRPCNANCENVTQLRAIVIYWRSYYTDMIMQGANQ